MTPILIFILFMSRDAKTAKAKPIYHRTWPDEVPGYPASDFVKNL